MNWRSRTYIGLTALGGLSAAVELPRYWHCEDPLRFFVFTVLAIWTAAWHVSLPGAPAKISGNILFVLVAAAQLNEGETLLVAILAAAAQWGLEAPSQRMPNWMRLAFYLGSMAIAVRITTLTFDLILPAFPAIGPPLRLALAAIAYFIFSTVPEAILDALGERTPLYQSWKHRFFWAFPYYLIAAAISGLLWSVTAALGWQAATLAAPAIYLLHRWYTGYLERLEMERNHAREMADLHLRTIEALALAIEARDSAGASELRRVQLYCTAIGRFLGMGEQELQALLAASLLRDIGKLAVPEHITSKPGVLTPEEFEKIKIHPIVGAEILERVRFPYPVVPIVRHHHEKWDGNGYPDHISGDSIPLGARILSAVDCFDALSSERQYRPALPTREALRYIESEAGRSFDPLVVAALVNQHESLEREVQQRAATEAGTEQTNSGGERTEFVESIAAARAEAQFLFAISQDLTVSIDPDAMFAKFSARLRETIPFDTLAYFHLEGTKLRAIYVSGAEQERIASLRIPLGQGLTGWAVQEQKPVLNGNPAVELIPSQDSMGFTNLRTALVAPVGGAEGVTGALALYSNTKDSYDRDQLRILMAVADRVAFQVENSLRFQKASGDAFIDDLTGLANSRWLVSHLRETCREAAAGGPAFMVMVLDLDGFKMVNDTHGHLLGNEVLREIAVRGARLLHESGRMARMGGDEFVVILPRLSYAEGMVLAGKLQTAIEQVGVDLLHDGRLSCSWGLAEFGKDGTAPQELIAEADHRMYAYKRGKQERMTLRLARLAQSVNGDWPGTPAAAPAIAGRLRS